MILIVDMDQPEHYDAGNGSFRLKRKMERMTGHPCVAMNYPDVSLEFVSRYGIGAIFITGFGYGWDKVPVQKLWPLSDLMHQTDVPTWGACGGHQLLGFIFSNLHLIFHSRNGAQFSFHRDVSKPMAIIDHLSGLANIFAKFLFGGIDHDVGIAGIRALLAKFHIIAVVQMQADRNGRRFCQGFVNSPHHLWFQKL